MPPLQSSRNPFLRNLHGYLGAEIEARELRAMGWFEFSRFDAKPDCSAPQLAEDAFCALSFERGVWTRDERVLAAVLAFLEEKTSTFATEQELKKLREILGSNQLNAEPAVRTWFKRNYP